MPKIFTTPEAEQKAKALLHDITLAGGIRTNSQKRGSTSFSNSYTTAAQKICTELTNRDFADIDIAIKEISYYGTESFNGKWFHLKPEAVAKAIVYMAELINIYWDDTIRTPYEVDVFKKTLLGDAVYKYGRYISAIKDPKATKAASNSGASTSTSANSTNNTASATSTATTSSAPQNGYKASGPQSGNVRDLQGNPGDKVIADTNLIYKIIADKVTSNTPNVFIKPLSASGATGSTNKIFISSGNGYTDCTCYFDDPNEAQKFLDKIIAAGRVPSNINNLRVVKMKADPNGYFLVGTEFGVVAVSAKTLNEALTESAEEDLSGGWTKATEKYSKEEIDELHAWMRKD
jgi:hypothetical protein